MKDYRTILDYKYVSNTCKFSLIYRKHHIERSVVCCRCCTMAEVLCWPACSAGPTRRRSVRQRPRSRTRGRPLQRSVTGSLRFVCTFCSCKSCVGCERKWQVNELMKLSFFKVLNSAAVISEYESCNVWVTDSIAQGKKESVSTFEPSNQSELLY